MSVTLASAQAWEGYLEENADGELVPTSRWTPDMYFAPHHFYRVAFRVVRRIRGKWAFNLLIDDPDTGDGDLLDHSRFEPGTRVRLYRFEPQDRPMVIDTNCEFRFVDRAPSDPSDPCEADTPAQTHGDRSGCASCAVSASGSPSAASRLGAVFFVIVYLLRRARRRDLRA